MPKYDVIFTTETSSSITVEAADGFDAMVAATERLPGSLCHQCAGSRRGYNRDEDVWEPSVVYDADGNEVWSATATVPDTTGASSLPAYNPDDAEDCPACVAVEDLCPYHRGVEAGIRLAVANLQALAEGDDR